MDTTKQHRTPDPKRSLPRKADRPQVVSPTCTLLQFQCPPGIIRKISSFKHGKRSKEQL